MDSEYFGGFMLQIEVIYLVTLAEIMFFDKTLFPIIP